MKFLRGWFGEQKATLAMWLMLDSNAYQRIHNIILPSKSGTTQIDHLIISVYGLFTIETKNKKGWIFGSPSNKTWTQVLYNKKYSFQNPLRQTYRQKKILAEFLSIDEGLITDVVYFVGDCKFKTPLPDNVLRKGLRRYIKSFKEQVLYPEEVNEFVRELRLHKETSGLKTKDHLKSLRRRKSDKLLCPRCGSLLVERTAKKGVNAGNSFLGCSGFPKCRYTTNI